MTQADSADGQICIRVFNSAGGCVSWRQCDPADKDLVLEQLRGLFQGPQFRFEQTPDLPDVPADGYTKQEAQARSVRFVKNIT